MAKKLLMGNEAIALGALRAGVNVVSGYPGTPSTEVLETIAKHKKKSVYKMLYDMGSKGSLVCSSDCSYV